MKYYEFYLPEGHYIMVQEGFLRNFMIRLGIEEILIAANLNSKSFTLGDYRINLVTHQPNQGGRTWNSL